MDKSKILNNYINSIYNKMDELRQTYPKSKSEDILQMEKGFRYAVTKSSEWIEEMLTIVDSTINVENPRPTYPLHQAIDNSIAHTNKISHIGDIRSEDQKKKKSFFQVAGEAAKDLGKDIFEANQMSLSKEDKK